ncbi:MAG: hypothetical protein R6U04_08890 [Bacteroidales bacterium]
MLNKVGNIILAVLVLCTTAGMIVNQHYTDGKLYSASFYSNPESCCNNDDGEHKATCNDVFKFYKVEDEFRVSNQILISVPFTFIVQTYVSNCKFETGFAEHNTYLDSEIFTPVFITSAFLQVYIL